MEGRDIHLSHSEMTPIQMTPIQLGGWDADGHLRGVQVQPEPHDVDGGGEALLGGEGESKPRADERVEGPTWVGTLRCQ